ncbi:MAG: RrF2 family transcriptional regulator [Candidatus Sumerlaeaceae bacterium]|jgi:Rrf2 family protein
MLALNQTTAYAILTLGLLEDPNGKPLHVEEIARATGIPRAYLAKLVYRLRRKGFVTTRRGFRGGVTLARPANAIALLEVAEAVTGRPFSAPCLLGLRICGDSATCPLNRFWTKTVEMVRQGLLHATVADAGNLRCVASARRLRDQRVARLDVAIKPSLGGEQNAQWHDSGGPTTFPKEGRAK